MEQRHTEQFRHAVTLHNSGKVAEAMHTYDALLPFADDDAFILFAAGSALCQLGNYGCATVLLEKSVKGNPDNYEAWINLGLAYRTAGRVDKGIECYQQALRLPLPVEARAGLLGNLSGCYVNEGNPQECLKLAEEGLALKDLPQLHNHRALALLEMGRYKEGFAEYEHRFKLPEFFPRNYGPVAKWDGRPVEHLVIHGEQGLGDELLFLTWLKHAFPYAENIYIECAARLQGLLTYTFRDRPEVKLFPTYEAMTRELAPEGWDKKDERWAWTAMGSLPNLFDFEPWVYLQSSRHFNRGEKRRVGLSWRGGTMKTHEYYRNGPLEDWKHLVAVLKAQGDEVISLQYGPAEHMAKMLDIPHDSGAIEDLDTLCGLVQSCDLVITVCNTTVHMAGASGTPAICLVPSKPAWRYGLQGDKSDWYESVRYIRQNPGENWSDVMPRLLVDNVVRGLKVAA